jgi:hypothetical protein
MSGRLTLFCYFQLYKRGGFRTTETRARALLTRLGTFLDQFTTCFSRRAHRTYASRYLQGLPER